MNLDTDIAETSRRLSEQTAERADRIRLGFKFAFEHDRRSFGQKHRQTCERVARIFEELEARYGQTQDVGDGIRT